MTETHTQHTDKAEGTTVFFSYSRVDVKAALPIIAAIEQAGYKVWWDGMLEGGTNFLETTEEALETAKAVVVLWSQTSVKSHWVRDEAMSGRVRDRLVPISLDGTEPPLGFRQVQVINFSNWKQRPEAPVVQDLCRSLAILHDQETAPATQPHIHAQTSRPLSRRAILLGTGGLTLGLLGGLALTNRFSGAQKVTENSIAVLPFQSLSNQEDADYLVTGLSSEIRAHLARNVSLKVMAQSSSTSAAAEALSAQEISKRLGVANILEGSVNVIGSTMRVSVELIEGKSGFNLWADEFIHTVDNILTLKNAIAEALVTVMTAQADTTQSATHTGSTQNAVAFNEYLKGHTLFRANSSRESIRQALDHMNIAISLDPQFGQALAVKAQILLWLGVSSADSQLARDYLDSAVQSAKAAVAASPDFGDAHSTLGYVLVGAKLDLKGAQAPYEKSRMLGLGSAPILARYATYMAVTGEHDNALPAIQQAIDFDPLNPTIHSTAGLIHYAAGRYEASIEAYSHVLNLTPDYFNAKAHIGMALINLGRVDEAMAICETERNQMERLPCLAIGHRKQGQMDLAQQAMDTLVETFGDAGAYQQVQVLAQWGEVDEAMRVLNTAMILQDSGLTLAGFDPNLNPLRQRQDFLDVLAQLGFRL